MRALADASTPPPPRYHAQQSPWHSPVPYLFGGLAAMLGLIAFALLVLACSYWRLSGYLEQGEDAHEGDEKCDGGGFVKPPPVYEEKVVVIMAGEERPTFLATPVSSRASSFNDSNGKMERVVEEEEEEAVDGCDRLSTHV